MIVIGTGFAVISYQTDYGRVLVQNTSFDHEVYFNTYSVPRNPITYVIRRNNIYVETRLFIFSKKTILVGKCYLQKSVDFERNIPIRWSQIAFR